MSIRRSSPTSGKHFRRSMLLVEQLESRRLLAGVWQNPRNALDVDDSGIASPLDALQVINDLDDNGSRQLPLSRPALAAYLGREKVPDEKRCQEPFIDTGYFFG
ncbi:MAG: hypothetical protein H6821_03875 [Planctomycetaceae bacterium]|nr:hypothetical protein [Planctomycetaceae bacterium]